jgi:hypothetical protein
MTSVKPDLTYYGVFFSTESPFPSSSTGLEPVPVITSDPTPFGELWAPLRLPLVFSLQPQTSNSNTTNIQVPLKLHIYLYIHNGRWKEDSGPR